MLAPWKKNYEKPRQHIKKQRHHFAHKICIVKYMVFFFSVVMYECENWTIKKAKGQQIDGFELWCWRRLLRVPLDCKEINQSMQKGIKPEYLLEGLIRKFQYFSH